MLLSGALNGVSVVQISRRSRRMSWLKDGGGRSGWLHTASIMIFKVSFIGTFVNKLSSSNDASSFGCFTVFTISMNSWVDSIMWRFCINGAIMSSGVWLRRTLLSPLVILLIVEEGYFYRCAFWDCHRSMGTPLGPMLANFYMCHLENNCFQYCPQVKPPTYCRYIDGNKWA